jgi:signal transduction histidine kinase
MMPGAPNPSMSLKLRLGFGAAVLGAGTLLTAAILYFGLNAVADRLDTAIAAEKRMSRYAVLSTQTATFLVVATEAVQRGQPPDVRADRLAPVTGQMRDTFRRLREDVEQAVLAARQLGIDEQSRYGTQSLGLARMEALLESTVRGLTADTEDRDRLRANLDGFATSFDPLLSQAVNTEVMFRNQILAGIDALRVRLTLAALVIAAVTLALVAGFYFGLIRPQFGRLDQLRAAAHQIGREDFAVALPMSRMDEIGQLSAETNRAAAALSARRDQVREEWDRLNDTIAQRTEELRTANATLAEVDANRRRLFADISHELRTPLTVILMEAQIGKQGSADPQAAFATIESRAARLNRRIDDLLRLARSDDGQLALDMRAVSLRALARAVQEEVQAEIDNAGMELEVEEVADIPVTCDPNWVRQVVVGLVRNAIRHARGGGAVRLGAVEDAGRAGLRVVDNGPGIDARTQGRVFDRFAQGASPAASQGFGVGLALAKWVIEAQEGQIDLQSPVPRAEAIGRDAGTKILVRLPRAAD